MIETKLKPMTAEELLAVVDKAIDLAAGRPGQRAILRLIGEVFRLRGKVRYMRERIQDLEADRAARGAPALTTPPGEHH